MTPIAKSKMLDCLAAVAVAPNAEEEVLPLLWIPDLRDEGEVFACGAVGHGMSSWYFRLVLKTERLRFDITLPCWRVLADPEVRDRDSQNIGVACRFALVVLGAEGFPAEGARFEVEGGERGDCHWRLVSSSGEEMQFGEDWGSILDLLANSDAAGSAAEMFVIKP